MQGKLHAEQLQMIFVKLGPQHNYATKRAVPMQIPSFPLKHSNPKISVKP